MIYYFVVAMSVVALIAVVGFVTRQEAARPDVRFPPISDEEFLELCGPGTDPQIALGVRRIISKHLNVPEAEIHPSMRWHEDLRT